jgi:GT2 family glycosyltransferase
LAERPSLSVLIVCFDSAAELRRTLPALVGELDEGDELIVADNGSTDGSLALAAQLAPQARRVDLGENRGFAAACNAAAAEASGDLLVLLNPDAKPLPGFGEAIRRPAAEGRDWDAWMALVVCERGTTVNTAGNPVHFTGIAWAGGHGEPLRQQLEPRQVPTASGACLAIPLQRWRALGGFAEQFFLYHEDVDLSFRIRLAGGLVGIEPEAVVDHEYEFGGRPQKWRWLERNRWAFLIRVYPGPLLALVAPALVATELVMLPAALAGGWLGQKLRANVDVVRWLPRLLRERRAIQRGRAISSAEFASWLRPDLDSPNLPTLARSTPVRLALRAYWRLVRLLLGRAPGAERPE